MALTVAFPPTGAIHNLRMTTQFVGYSGLIAGLSTPASGVAPVTRLANLAPELYRLHLGNDGGALANVLLPFHAAYSSAAPVVSVTAWDFTRLNDALYEAFQRSASFVFNPRYGPDNLWTGTAPMGGGGGTGVYSDRTFQQLADWFAQVIRYYNAPDDGSGLRPVGWSTGLGGGTNPNNWPPKRSDGVTLLSFAKANGGAGLRYIEVLNEVDFATETPRQNRPQCAAPTLTLASVNVSGGTLVPGTTYSYRSIAVDSDNETTAQSAAATIVLGAGSNAVRITWTTPVTTGLPTAGIQIQGRTSGSEQVITFVGKDVAAGQTFDDKGTITPSGAYGNSITGYVFSPREYLSLWDKVATAVNSIDSTVKLISSSKVSPIGFSNVSIITTVGPTTGPADTSYLDNRDLYQQVVGSSVRAPDYVAYHDYGGSGGAADTDAALMNRIDGTIADIQTEITPFTGSIPLLHTETNTNSAADTLQRATRSFYLAWMGRLFVKLASAFNPNIRYVHHFCFSTTNNIYFGQIAGPDETAPPDGNPYLAYWFSFYVNAAFLTGSKVCTVSGTPAGVETYAVAQPPDFTKIRVLVVNRNVPASNVNVDVTLSGAPSTATRHRIIDSTTVLTSVDIGAPIGDGTAATVNLQLNGYAVAIVEFDTPATSATVEFCAPIRTMTVGGSEARW